MKQKSVGLTLRAFIIALALILVAGSPALPPFDGVAYAQSSTSALTGNPLPNGNVPLEWTAVSGADSYRLWKGAGSGGSVAWGTSAHMTFNAPTVTYTDTAVTAGMTYSYVVEIYDGDTRLGWSNVLNVTIPGGTPAPTDKPSLTLAADGLTAITITWTEVPRADNYRVRYWTAGMPGWMDLATAETGLTLSHETLTPGTQYYYIVRGQNDRGNGPYSGSAGNYDSHTLMATDTVPTLTSTHVSRQEVQLSWTATSATATYSLERRKSLLADSSDGTWETLTLSAADQSSRTYTDNNATYDSATDTAADPLAATRYHYRVQAVEGGTPGQYSNVEVVTIPDSGVRPTPPSDLEASAGSDAVSVIKLEWTATAGTTSEIRWKTSTRDWSDPIAASTPYNHPGRSPSTEYTYQVRAVNVNGPSLWSTEVKQSTTAAPATGGQMPKVTGLTVMDESSLDADTNDFVPKIKLEWDQVTSATHYDIWRFPSGDTNTTAWAAPATGNELTAEGRIAVDDLESPTSPSWEDEDSNITAATTYYYVVSAVDNKGTTDTDDDDMGEWSADDSTTTIAETVGTDAPDLTTTVTGPTSIWLSWTTVENATKYTIQWRVGNGSYRTISDLTGTTHHHQRLTANTEYLYRVRAENADSMTAYSDPEVSETTWRSGLQPPSNFMAEDATTGYDPVATQAFIIEVSWDAAPGAAGYQLQRWNPATGTVAWEDVGTSVQGTGTTTDESVDDEARAAGTTYYYRVRTVSATDMSAWSSTVSATTDPTRPTEAPSLATTSTGMNTIRISWEGESDATMYTLEVVEGIAEAASGFATPMLSRDFTENVRHFVHTGLKPGTRYSYRIKSVLTDEVESPFTADAAIESEYTKPSKPELTAKAVDHLSIRLSWSPVPFVTAASPTAAGHLTANTNYRIERRQTGTSVWTEVNITAGIGACTTDAMMQCSFVDTDGGSNLAPGQRYFYRIRATETRESIVYTSYWDYANNYTQADPDN